MTVTNQNNRNLEKEDSNKLKWKLTVQEMYWLTRQPASYFPPSYCARIQSQKVPAPVEVGPQLNNTDVEQN